MGKKHQPRSGSLQFWPRVRTKRIYANVKSWIKKDKPLAFAGYKVGMTHIQENNPNSKFAKILSTPVTIIECPPLKPLSLRFYKNTPYGSKIISEIFSKNLDKELSRKITLPKKEKEIKIPENYDYLKLSVYTQPKLVGTERKKPEIFEMAITNNLDEAKKLLETELKISELFKAGQYVDIHSVTKGKGFQGPVKRFGISLKSHKSEKKRRSAGNLGPFTPRKVNWRVPQHGQLGFFKRTEYNKLIYLIDNNLEKINQKGGFKGYGLIKNDYILIKGSIGGPKKRLIIFTENIRDKKDKAAPEITYISTESKQ
jgi:large subunit ribosomal protein L3|tara:strand:+ start:413 stop:1351 length:939 start_codon:yes stop_codon:yes gene_type:complete